MVPHLKSLSTAGGQDGPESKDKNNVACNPQDSLVSRVGIDTISKNGVLCSDLDIYRFLQWARNGGLVSVQKHMPTLLR